MLFARYAVVMSALGQKQTSGDVRLMSALPPKADITGRREHVRECAARKRRTFVLSFLIWIKFKFVADKLPCNLRKGAVLQPKGISALTAF